MCKKSDCVLYICVDEAKYEEHLVLLVVDHDGISLASGTRRSQQLTGRGS